MSSTYSLRIEYDKEISKPERVFESMGLMVKGFNQLNSAFVKGFGNDVKFSSSLRETHEGSLIATIGNVVSDIKRNVSFERICDALYEGTKNKIANVEKVDSEDDVQRFVQDVFSKVKETEIDLENYLCGAEVNLYEVADALYKISKGIESLAEKDVAQFGRDKNFVNINDGFSCRRKASEIFEIITEDNNSEEIVVIRRASHVPDLYWDLENKKRKIKNFSAKMKDLSWLNKWRNHEVQLWPGDGIRAKLSVKVKRNPINNTISTENEIIEVMEVIEQQVMEQTEIDLNA